MTHTDRGTKRRCGNCGAPFYDLARMPPVCPKCQTEYVEPVRPPSRSSRASSRIPVLPVINDTESVVEDEVLAADLEESEEEIDVEEKDEDEAGISD